MLKLKLQHFGHIMGRDDSLEDPDAGKDGGQKENGMTEDEMVGWHHWLNVMSLSKLQEIVKDREAWHTVAQEVEKSGTWLSDWTTTNGALEMHVEH